MTQNVEIFWVEVKFKNFVRIFALASHTSINNLQKSQTLSLMNKLEAPTKLADSPRFQYIHSSR